MDIKTITVYNKLSNEERETLLHYDYVDKVWKMDSTVTKHFNRAVRQGWKPMIKYIYEDGSICGMVLTALDRAVTIRNTEKKQMTEKQMVNLVGDDEEDED